MQGKNEDVKISRAVLMLGQLSTDEYDDASRATYPPMTQERQGQGTRPRVTFCGDDRNDSRL